MNLIPWVSDLGGGGVGGGGGESGMLIIVSNIVLFIIVEKLFCDLPQCTFVVFFWL